MAEPRSRQSAPRVAFAVLLVACAVGLGAAVALAVIQPVAPAALKPAATASTIAVASEDFVDERSVEVRLQHGGDRQLYSGLSGRITRFDCTVGVAIKSGTSPVALDGRRLIALATRVPLWRNLTAGARGSDVTALTDELSRLGYPVDKGVFGSTTLRSWNRLLSKAGAAKDTSVDAAQVLWLPSPSASVSSCLASVGAAIQAGAPLASFPAALVGASVVALPDGLIPGQRVLSVAGLRIPVTADGRIDLASDLAKIASTQAYALALGDPNSPNLQGRLRLRTPVAISVVPPGAIVGTDDKSCVIADGVPQPVTVVGSQLGQTFVTFSGKVPAAVSVAPPVGTTCG